MMTQPSNPSLEIANRAYTLMERRNVIAQGDQVALYAVPLDDSVLLIVDPLAISNVHRATSSQFVDHLKVALHGRQVMALHLDTGIYYRISYAPLPPKREMKSRALDLTRQPNPLAVPLGSTATRDVWLTFGIDIDAVLIGGARRMGKTNLLHGWIASLVRGGEAHLVLFDGKDGAEFERYRNAALFGDDAGDVAVVIGKLAPALRELLDEMDQRLIEFRTTGVTSIDAHNNKVKPDGLRRLKRIVLIVDELAFALQEEGVEQMLVDLIARGGAVGIHPVLATQRPSSDVVTPNLKTNLSTRICFAVPDRASSFVVLDRSGAEKIAKEKGRLIIVNGAQMVEAQTFDASAEIASVKKLPAPRKLNERELKIAQAATEQGGEFRPKHIADAVGESVNKVIDLAREWEARGWLTPVERTREGNKPRRITATLGALFAECANVANVAECG